MAAEETESGGQGRPLKPYYICRFRRLNVSESILNLTKLMLARAFKFFVVETLTETCDASVRLLRSYVSLPPVRGGQNEDLVHV